MFRSLSGWTRSPIVCQTRPSFPYLFGFGRNFQCSLWAVSMSLVWEGVTARVWVLTFLFCWSRVCQGTASPSSCAWYSISRSADGSAVDYCMQCIVNLSAAHYFLWCFINHSIERMRMCLFVVLQWCSCCLRLALKHCLPTPWQTSHKLSTILSTF